MIEKNAERERQRIIGGLKLQLSSIDVNQMSIAALDKLLTALIEANTAH